MLTCDAERSCPGGGSAASRVRRASRPRGIRGRPGHRPRRGRRRRPEGRRPAPPLGPVRRPPRRPGPSHPRVVLDGRPHIQRHPADAPLGIVGHRRLHGRDRRLPSPPYLDLDVIAEDSINRNGDKVVSTLRDRGERAGREYFQRVQGIETVARKEVTMRPTRSPTGRPTPAPTGDPTPVPSGMPSEFPSLEPSGVPSRTLDNVIMTGSREDLQLGGLTTSSYGYVFNIRTKPDANVVLLTGMDFYTESTSDVNFELWTYAGNYQDKKGAVDGSWTKIGGGVTRGRGIGRYTTIPEGMFKPTSIDGGGASRAFYLTLDTINLVYKLGKDAGIRGAPPDTYVHHESPDIEVWEGEGVLQYNRTNAKEGLPPFPDTSVTVFYRYPRSYLGAIYYDRVPCKPYSVYGDLQSLPCPLVPTGTPTVPPPTKSPATAEPSVQPTTEAPTTAAPIPGVTPAPITPTESPTVAPTSSFPPTMFPTTTRPTNSPVIPMRTNFVATLRNVPKRDMTSREVEKYIEILTAFLRRHTEQSMVIEGIEFWHQHLLVLPAMVEELEEEDAEEPALAAAEEESEEPDAGEEEGKDDSAVAEDESALAVEETELSPEEELTIDAELAAVEKEASKLADDGGDGQPDEEEADEDEGDEEDASPQIAGKRSLHPSKKRHVHPAPEVLDCDHPELAHAAGYTCGMEVHLILKVSYAFLPYELLSDMAVVAIEENESELLDLLHEQQAFYTFFRNMDQVTSRVIEGDMTLAPTVAPSTLAYMEANQAQEILNLTATEDSGIGFGVMVGVGVGFLWCCLTAVAVACLMKARGEIMEQRDMENLLKAQRDGPIASSSSSPPEVRKDAELGSKHDHSTDSDDESDPFDHTKNSRLAPRARAEVAKSVREGGAGSGAVVAHRVSHARSMVVQRNRDDIGGGQERRAAPLGQGEPGVRAGGRQGTGRRRGPPRVPRQVDGGAAQSGQHGGGQERRAAPIGQGAPGVRAGGQEGRRPRGRRAQPVHVGGPQVGSEQGVRWPPW
ncbi:hypothetical protein THAOC_30810 [Thalassiosira oceanica]|uniref:Uncharacterized protein n=1 Tax=Thalassiosira oceanica TaxID=159749 RepID=K0RUE1_THAOC|nr:hypothetical protein THAOC_30810 [Thalassiosira oceanica]|eukprot:EJK50247.1 hypothetical protein THAOC_30810 [Thalassiosira oceanica]